MEQRGTDLYLTVGNLLDYLALAFAAGRAVDGDIEERSERIGLNE